MPRYKAVVAIASGRILYQGKEDLKAAQAFEPGTCIGYSDEDQEAATARALAASHRLRGRSGASGGLSLRGRHDASGTDGRRPDARC